MSNTYDRDEQPLAPLPTIVRNCSGLPLSLTHAITVIRLGLQSRSVGYVDAVAGSRELKPVAEASRHE